MTEQQEARHILERAEHAAASGDLASAGELLSSAARIQEEELGPLHPDLANTLNNLAVVAEGTGRWSEAESLYRRSAAIAAAALPPDHPMVVASRQNLEDFCRAHGLSLDSPTVITPDPVTPETIAAQPRPVAPAPGRAAPPFRWVAIGAVVLGASVLLMLRPWSTRDAPAPAPKPAPVASEPAAMSPRQANRCDRRRPRRAATIETPPFASRPRRAVSPWPARNCAAPSRRAAGAGAATRWASPRCRDRSSSSLVSRLRAMPPWCIAGTAETR